MHALRSQIAFDYQHSLSPKLPNYTAILRELCSPASARRREKGQESIRHPQPPTPPPAQKLSMQTENAAVNKRTFASFWGQKKKMWRPGGDARDFNCRNLITRAPAASAFSWNSFTVCCRPVTLSYINLRVQPCAQMARDTNIPWNLFRFQDSINFFFFFFLYVQIVFSLKKN